MQTLISKNNDKIHKFIEGNDMCIKKKKKKETSLKRAVWAFLIQADHLDPLGSVHSPFSPPSCFLNLPSLQI